MGSVKKYQCKKCSKTYNHRQHLYRHKQNCINSVINECIQCSKVFVRADTLKKHIKKCKKNSQQKEKVCSLCSKEFVKVWHLQRHLKHICNRKTNINVVTVTKHIQENHFIDAILKNAMTTLQQESPLLVYQKLMSY